MSEDQSRFLQLYERFINDKATPEEVREFWALAGILEDDDVAKDVVYSLYDDKVPEEVDRKDWSEAGERIFGRKAKRFRIVKQHWWVAAASIIFILGIGGYLISNKKNDIPQSVIAKVITGKVHDVAPPSISHATITLGNGRKISIDSVNSGILALQNNIALTKTADGKIKYASGEREGNQGLVYNTLTNPKGSRVINMVLNDGSRVWLNAASTITYPVAFEGVDREVSVTGEVYFEVAHDLNKKFIVKTKGLSTEVLGTHFNVNSYPDEDDVKVTLLEGRVKVVSNNGASSVIKPGEQAIDGGNGKLRIHKNVNVEDVIAWKNERFSFNDTNIKKIMKEVARWYDVQIEYRGSVDDLNFGGNMSRQKNVSELLKRMEATQAVKFEVEGRKITVIIVP